MAASCEQALRACQRSTSVDVGGAHVPGKDRRGVTVRRPVRWVNVRLAVCVVVAGGGPNVASRTDSTARWVDVGVAFAVAVPATAASGVAGGVGVGTRFYGPVCVLSDVELGRVWIGIVVVLLTMLMSWSSLSLK